MRAELHRLHARLGVTTVYVTHDQVEAMTLGDRIAVMRGGRLEQVDAPETLYEAPATVFVAGFIGAPRMNLRPGRWSRADGRSVVDVLGQRLPLDVAGLAPPEGEPGEVVVGWRPEDLRWRPEAPPEWRDSFSGAVDLVEPLGSETYVTVRIGEGTLMARFPPRSGVRPGDTVELAFDTTRVHVFDARSERSLRRR
jgi:multiple sugar transport system ATP-binding protein